MIEFASQHRRAIMHIYKSVNREMFENYLMEVSEYLVRSYIEIAVSEAGIGEKSKQSLTDYYKCVCFGLIIEWLNKGMKEEYAQEFRRILVMRKELVVETAKDLQE